MNAANTISVSVARRDVASRNTKSAHVAARALQRIGLRPNHLSGASVAFAGLAACSTIAMAHARGPALVALGGCAIALIVLRLLCNLFDGLIAIEGGLRSASGEVWNDAPDRPSDLLIVVGAGYAATSLAITHEIAWIAGSAALLTAYARVLGGALGLRQRFTGPMAKQHRMAVVIATIVAMCIERTTLGSDYTLTLGVGVIALGALFTTGRRLVAIVRELESSRANALEGQEARNAGG